MSATVLRGRSRLGFFAARAAVLRAAGRAADVFGMAFLAATFFAAFFGAAFFAVVLRLLPPT